MKIISQIFTILFTTFWVLFLFTDYWDKHPAYSLVIEHFEYSGLIIFLLAGGALCTWVGNQLKKRKKRTLIGYTFSDIGNNRRRFWLQ